MKIFYKIILSDEYDVCFQNSSHTRRLRRVRFKIQSAIPISDPLNAYTLSSLWNEMRKNYRLSSFHSIVSLTHAQLGSYFLASLDWMG